MTSKIQNIAMFAVAAFALAGMGFAPAYATHQTVNEVFNVPEGDIETSAVDQTNCGSGGDCDSKMKVYNTGSDKIKVYYNVADETCDVNIKIYEKGNPDTLLKNWDRSNYQGQGASISHSVSIAATDDFKTIVTYTC